MREGTYNNFRYVMVVRGQLRVGAADLQCGVAVGTVDSQNPSSYVDYTCYRLCIVYVYVRVGVRAPAPEKRGQGKRVDSSTRALNAATHTYFARALLQTLSIRIRTYVRYFRTINLSFFQTISGFLFASLSSILIEKTINII